MDTYGSLFITAGALRAALDQGQRLAVLDASVGRPGSTEPSPSSVYASAHVPGAFFLDMEAVCDRAAPWPHMLPSADDFAAALQNMGLDENAALVIYGQQSTTMGPARLWWMLQVFGHRGPVRILDGGLPAWEKAGGTLQAGTPATLRPGTQPYRAEYNASLVADRQIVQAALSQNDALIIDARPAARFYGQTPEPRPGLNAGHIPGSVNIPATAFLDESGFMRPRDVCESLLTQAGVDSKKPVIATCGSGITACMIALAAQYCGLPAVRIYDASWCEWGCKNNNLPFSQ